MSNQQTLANLIRTVSQRDPTLYSALQLLIKDLYQVYGEVFPASSVASASSAASGTPDDVTGFSLSTTLTNLRLTWDAANNAVQYEIRKGADWDTASFVLRTSQLVANIDPIVNDFTTGTHTLLIKGISSSGIYSSNATGEDLVVPQMSSPSLTGTGIANNALLSWTAPLSTWLIAYYKVYRDGLEIAQVNANFMISSELIAGTYSYTVKAVDIVGNESDESPAVVLVLDDPIDIIFIDSIDADLTGTYSNTARATINGLDGVIGAIFDTETFEDHFINNSWGSPADQIAAGYERYIEPTETSGYYEEEFDFGEVLENVTVIAGYSKLTLFGTTTITTDISYSEDGIIWSTPETATAILALAVRYVRIRWNFSNLNDESAAFIHGLKCSISTQLVLDSGTGFADKDDVGGTTITMNKTYKQVNSITLTSNTVQPVYMVFDDVTTNTFDVFAYDSSGNRVDCDFSWKVRGII